VAEIFNDFADLDPLEELALIAVSPAFKVD
jgi:hypothetical protein